MGYPAFWVRDAVMMLESDFIELAELRGMDSPDVLGAARPGLERAAGRDGAGVCRS